jgi:hypothetical protein
MDKNSLRAVELDLDALIPLREAAELLGLDPSTIRKRSAGTANSQSYIRVASCFWFVVKSLPTVEN